MKKVKGMKQGLAKAGLDMNNVKFTSDRFLSYIFK
jgi:hypothetical protein